MVSVEAIRCAIRFPTGVSRVSPAVATSGRGNVKLGFSQVRALQPACAEAHAPLWLAWDWDRRHPE